MATGEGEAACSAITPAAAPPAGWGWLEGAPPPRTPPPPLFPSSSQTSSPPLQGAQGWEAEESEVAEPRETREGWRWPAPGLEEERVLAFGTEPPAPRSPGPSTHPPTHARPPARLRVAR